MASLIKIKRSNVAAKRPTTSDIAAGELALNTKDKRAFSSDGGVVFEIGANVHSLSVGSGAFSIANGAITFPTSDGSVGQVLSTDGSGTLSFSSISSSSLADGAVTRSKVTSDIVANTYLQPLIANTNTWITAVETREAAHTANTLLHLANTNSYIATKVSTSTFNSALANTNSYIAYVAANAGEVSNAYLSSTYTTNTVFQSALANTNSYIATKVSTSTFNSALVNTNSYIAAVETREAAHTANTLLHLANTNSYIATKVSTSTFNSALANTNSYIATVQSDVDSNEATERAALANTNSYIATKANIASPTFTGVPAAPTASAGTNTTQIATTAFVRTEVTNLIDSAPTTLDTLNELAAALGDDPNFATTIASTYQTKSVERAALANTNSYIATKLSSSSYTAADVLSKLLTVDGAGTGLDADTLDGVQGASYLRSDAVDYGVTLELNGGSTYDPSSTGASETSTDVGLALGSGTRIVGHVNGYIRTLLEWNSSSDISIGQGGTTIIGGINLLPGNSGDAKVNGNRILTVADEGSGNGLDADTLDGVQGASFLRSDANDSFSGAITGTGSISISGLIRTTGSGYTVLLGTDAGGSVSLGRTDNVASTPYIDFNSGATSVDYDARIQATGGSGSPGGGTLNVEAGSFNITGAFTATTKSFVIDHPTKEGMKLRYGSLEGPENGVYVRGRLKDNNVIELPDYWTGLVDEDTITVNLTAIGKSQNLYVADIKDNKVYVKGSRQINCFYTVFGERKDVDKLEVEYESE